MTALVYIAKDQAVATSGWLAVGDHAQTYVTIPNSRLIPVKIPVPFDDFIQLVSESGKVLDLRKFQSESAE